MLLVCVVFVSKHKRCFFFLICIFCCFCNFLAPYQRPTLQKVEIPKTPKMNNAQNKDISKRAVSTVVLTNSALLLFGVVLKTVCAENTIK